MNEGNIAEDPSPDLRRAYRDAAIQMIRHPERMDACDINIEDDIDLTDFMSQSSEGAWVRAWVFVSADDVELLD